jgi:hypothetical protein
MASHLIGENLEGECVKRLERGVIEMLLSGEALYKDREGEEKLVLLI